MEQILRRQEMAEFAECLQPHQKVKLGAYERQTDRMFQRQTDRKKLG